MELRPGQRLRSSVCTTEVVVIKATSGDVDLRCGGQVMVPVPGEEPSPGLVLTDTSGTLLGKRYEHEASGLELLCTKAGAGGLSVGDVAIAVRASKALPSSD